MDVLLIDDKPGEGALLQREWGAHGVNSWQICDLTDLAGFISGGLAPGWDGLPGSLDAVVIDLDLGGQAEWSAGGLQALTQILEWQDQSGFTLNIVLRTQDVDDDRSLAAVLAAELFGGPLPLWGKTTKDVVQLLAYLKAVNKGPVPPANYGATVVHPVKFIKQERGERLLGEYLLSGRRGVVWERIAEGFDADIAIGAAGYEKAYKFWEQVNILFGAILHLHDAGDSIHLLGGTPLRLIDFERQVVEDELLDIHRAIYEVNQPDNPISSNSKGTILKNLSTRQAKLNKWLANPSKNKPSTNRDWDRGEFIGIFGRVLGNPEVLELFRKS